MKKNDNPLYNHLNVFCKACGKNTDITAGELFDKTSFICPHCGQLIKRMYPQSTADHTKRNIILKTKSDPELDKDIDEIICSRRKDILQIKNPICPVLVVATVLSPGNVMYSAAYCKELECALWDKQRHCCGLIQK